MEVKINQYNNLEVVEFYDKDNQKCILEQTDEYKIFEDSDGNHIGIDFGPGEVAIKFGIGTKDTSFKYKRFMRSKWFKWFRRKSSPFMIHLDRITAGDLADYLKSWSITGSFNDIKEKAHGATTRYCVELDGEGAITAPGAPECVKDHKIGELEDKVIRLEAECFKLSAGCCIASDKKGLIGGEYGHPECVALNKLKKLEKERV